MRTFKIINAIVLLSVVLINSCSPPKNKLTAREGYIQVDGGKVWYKIVGEGNKTPLLMLHGGPGVPSYYLKPLLALSNDRPVIIFDQLGCGKSDRITDTSMLTVEHFVNELQQVRDSLGLKDYYLLGQSWGTMLGTDFYLQHPEGIKALILSSPAISIPRWLADADILIATLPDSIQNAIRTNEASKTYDDPSYKNAVEVYYHNFLARKLPRSADFDSSFSQMGVNVYVYMGGPSEFTMTGPLKDYDRTSRLHEIKIPTLFITGEYDEARVPTVQYYQSLVPGAKLEIIENAGHLTMQDNPEKNLEVLRNFFKELEGK